MGAVFLGQGEARGGVREEGCFVAGGRLGAGSWGWSAVAAKEGFGGFADV